MNKQQLAAKIWASANQMRSPIGMSDRESQALSEADAPTVK
jgi:hypothetical protein